MGDNDTRLLLDSPANLRKLEDAEACWNLLKTETLRKGFHGISTLVMTIVDGTINKVESATHRSRPS